MKPLLIAEVKTLSPFGFQSQKSWDELFEIANRYGDWISVHTDARWGGSFELIAKARSLTKKPILAKGVHSTDADLVKAFTAGADYALVVGRIPNISLDNILLEPCSLSELTNLPTNVKVVWNARNLKTGKPKDETVADARNACGCWLCQASMISCEQDISPGVDAVLVGENLEEFVKHLNL